MCTIKAHHFCKCVKCDTCQGRIHGIFLDETPILYTIEIKPCGLGSRIRDMEAESYNWSHLSVNIYITFTSFGKQNWCCGMNRTLSVRSFLASNSLLNLWGLPHVLRSYFCNHGSKFLDLEIPITCSTIACLYISLIFIVISQNTFSNSLQYENATNLHIFAGQFWPE